MRELCYNRPSKMGIQMVQAKQKRSLTLLEIMIVIVLIGLIGSVIGFNVKGSLDEGKAFKTEMAQEQIKDILLLEVARGSSLEEVIERKEEILENSGLVKNAKNFLKDGWGIPFHIEIKGQSGHDLVVKSDRLNSYQQSKKNRLKSGSKSTQPAVSDSSAEDFTERD